MHQVLKHHAADRLQLTLSRPSTPRWRAATEELCTGARCAPRHLPSQASPRPFGPCSTAGLSRSSRPPVAGGRGRKSRPAPARRLMLLPRCGAPRPPLTTGRTMTCRASLVVAGMWSARGRGAALGRRCRRPVAAAAARVQGPGWCRLARALAALWRCRSRARPRPLLGPAGG